MNGKNDFFQAFQKYQLDKLLLLEKLFFKETEKMDKRHNNNQHIEVTNDQSNENCYDSGDFSGLTIQGRLGDFYIVEKSDWWFLWKKTHEPPKPTIQAKIAV